MPNPSMTDNAIKGRVMSQLMRENQVELLDECRCGNSFIQVNATGHRLEVEDVNNILDYIKHLEDRLTVNEIAQGRGLK